MRSLLLWVCLVAGCGSDAVGYDPQEHPVVPEDTETTLVVARDLSVLLPLPETAEQGSLLLRGTTAAAHGELVPPVAFRAIGKPLDARSALASELDARGALRLVAARLDPCFRSALTDACQTQLRGVFQVVEADGSAADGAVHVFYDLPADEYLRTVRQMLTLRKASGAPSDEPLGVHSAAAREGLDGDFVRGLHSVVLEHAGADRVRRVTFFVRTLTRRSTWIFGILEARGDGFVEAPIGTLASTKQQLSAAFSQETGLLGSLVQPQTTAADDLSLLFDTEIATGAEPAAREAAFDAALRIENPLRHTADSIDCVSCHSAASLRRSGEERFGLTDLRAVGYPGPAPLENPVHASIENIHAFGWLGREAGVNQRVANETHEAVVTTNALLAR